MDWLLDECGEFDDVFSNPRRGAYEQIAAYVDECEMGATRFRRPVINELAGIYAITHPRTRMRYVGKSVNIAERWAQHKSDIRAGRRCAISAWCFRQKIAIEDLRFWVIESAPGHLNCMEVDNWLHHSEKRWQKICRHNIGRVLGKGKGRVLLPDGSRY